MAENHSGSNGVTIFSQFSGAIQVKEPLPDHILVSDERNDYDDDDALRLESQGQCVKCKNCSLVNNDSQSQFTELAQVRPRRLLESSTE